MNRGATLACLAASLIACKEPPPKVIVGKDGKAQLAVPANWNEVTNLNDAASVQASRRKAELYAMVVAEPKSGLPGADLEDYSELTRTKQLASFEGGTEQGPERRVLNGFPALQYELRGAMKSGPRVVFLHAAVETRSSFLQVSAWTMEARYERQRELLQKVIDSAQVPHERPGAGWPTAEPAPAEPHEVFSTDGALRLTLPAKWAETTGLNDDADLQVARRPVAAFAVVLVDLRADAPQLDLEEVSKLGRSSTLSGLKETSEVGPERRTVGGHRALQYRLSGKANDQESTLLHTTVETPTRFVQVLAWTVSYRFERERKTLQAIVDSLREVEPKEARAAGQ